MGSLHRNHVAPRRTLRRLIAALAISLSGIAGLVAVDQGVAPAAEPLAIAPSGPHYADLGVAFQRQLVATGGSAPYSWSLTGGALPGGLSLATDGTISGVPSGPLGDFVATIQVADSSGPPSTATVDLPIQLGRGPSRLVAEPVLIRYPLSIHLTDVAATLTGGSPAVPIAGATVAFSAGSTPLCTATTDTNGRARCTIDLLGLLRLVARGKVTAAFAGDASWLPSLGLAGLL